MKISITLLLILSLATGAFAVPALYTKPVRINSTLIMESTQRSCDQEDTTYHWSFTINISGRRTDCAFNVIGSSEAGARYSPNPGKNCGQYVVTSSWSGQFGENDGFVTLSVANYPEKTIAWPAYRDDQLEGGGMVVPDQSYPKQTIQ